MKIAGYEVHPAAGDFPLLEGDEFKDFVASIKTQGLLHPITRLKRVLLDGRNRLRACEAAGVKPVFDEYGGDPSEEAIESWIIETNLRRRHLSETQRAMAAERGLAREAERAKGRLVEAGRKAGRGRKGKAKLPYPIEDSGQARDKVAKRYRVSGRAVQDAKKVREHGVPDLVKACERNDIAVSAAAKVATLPEAQQEAALEKLASGEARNIHQAKRLAQQEAAIASAPKTESPISVVHCGDAVELLKRLSPHAQLVLTDPPYGLDSHGTRDGGRLYADGREYAANLLDATCLELVRCIAPDAHLYFFSAYGWALEVFRRVISAHFDMQDNPLVWVKDNHVIADFEQWYASRYEHIIFAKQRGSSKKLREGERGDVFTCRRARDTTHAAEKPVDLLKHFIDRSSIPGDLILDPFCGSGSTGAAALMSGRQFLGMELDPQWAELAQARASGTYRAA